MIIKIIYYYLFFKITKQIITSKLMNYNWTGPNATEASDLSRFKNDSGEEIFKVIIIRKKKYLFH